MKADITIHPTDEIRLDDDWGYPNGIVVGGLAIHLHSEKAIDALQCALMDLRRARDDIKRKENGEQTEAEFFAGPELAGFEDEVA